MQGLGKEGLHRLKMVTIKKQSSTETTNDGNWCQHSTHSSKKTISNKYHRDPGPSLRAIAV